MKVANVEFKILCYSNQLSPFPNGATPLLLHFSESGDEQTPLFGHGEFPILLDHLDLLALVLERVYVVSHFLEGIEQALLHQLSGFLI